MGDARGFEEFVRSHAERAFQFAFRLLGNADQARELVQEAFYRTLRSWDSLERETLESWYFTVLRNAVADSRRSFRARKVVSLDAPADAGPDGEPDATYADLLPERELAVAEAFEERLKGDALRAALGSLSPEHRAVLLLCDVEGASYEDAARTFGVPLGTVRSRVSRARLAFRAAAAQALELDL